MQQRQNRREMVNVIDETCKQLLPSENKYMSYIQWQGWKLSLGQIKALGNKNLELNKIESCHHLRDWMLHLQTSVHLQKVELAGGIVL
jgi:Tfp pilus assembly protein PilN